MTHSYIIMSLSLFCDFEWWSYLWLYTSFGYKFSQLDVCWLVDVHPSIVIVGGKNTNKNKTSKDNQRQAKTTDDNPRQQKQTSKK